MNMQTRKSIAVITCLLLFSLGTAKAQELHSRWDELTAGEWAMALKNSKQTCILPIGILEKHGPHVPIGSDLIQVREWAARATKREYAVVFPDYFYGQINEAKHQPGIFAMPELVVRDLLEATCDEIGRNGFSIRSKNELVRKGLISNAFEILNILMYSRTQSKVFIAGARSRTRLSG